MLFKKAISFSYQLKNGRLLGISFQEETPFLFLAESCKLTADSSSPLEVE